MSKSSKILVIQLIALLAVAIGSFYAAAHNGELLSKGVITLKGFEIVALVIIIVAYFLVTLLLMRAKRNNDDRFRIKELLQKEKTLLEVKNKKLDDLNLSMRNVQQAISIIGADDKIEWINPSFTTMFGFTEEEAIGMRASDLLAGPETDRRKIEEIDQAVFQNHEAYSTTIVHYRKDKSTFWSRLHITPILADDGTLQKYIGISNDVTESKIAQDKLAESEANLKQIAKTVNEVIYLYNIVDKRYDFISENSREILGVEAELFYCGKSHDHLKWHKDDVQLILDANKKVDSGEAYDIEYRVQVDNEWRWIEERSFPIKDANGNVIRNSGVCTDITAKKANEIELKSAIEKTEILAEIGLEMSENLNIENIVRTTHSKISKLMPAQGFSIGLIKEKSREIVFPYFIDHETIFEDLRYSLDKNILATKCYHENKEIIINDFKAEHEEFFESKLDATAGDLPDSLIYLPIVNLGEVIGVVTVQSYAKNSYTESHVSMLRNISVYVSNALNNIKTVESLETTVAQRTLKVQRQKNEIQGLLNDSEKLNEIGIELTKTLKLDLIFEKLLESLRGLLDATIFSIRIYDKEAQNVEYSYTIEKEERFDPITVPMSDDENLTVWCIKNKAPLFINDNINEVPKYTKTIQVPMGGMAKSMIFSPMIVNDEVLGVVTVQSFIKNAYTKRDLHIMNSLAFYLGIAHSNGVLFETLEEKVEERTKEAENKTNELLQSIRYAQRIQRSSLTKESELSTIFEDSFLLYEPKDIVSGDFYNASMIRTNSGVELRSIVVADCTGHGVPGAVLAMTCNNIIQSTYSNPNINNVGEALNFTRASLNKLLSQSDEAIYDGMDLAWTTWNVNTNMLYFAGAFNNCYIIRNKEIITIVGDKMHVGYDEREMPFSVTELQLKPDDLVFMSTDGFPDQFGGPNFKKFTRKRFFDLMLSLDDSPLPNQKSHVLNAHIDWKGKNEQTDDLCMFCFRVSKN